MCRRLEVYLIRSDSSLTYSPIPRKLLYRFTMDSSNLGPGVLAVSWVFGALAIIIVGTRYYVRLRIVERFTIDDWLIALVLVNSHFQYIIPSTLLTDFRFLIIHEISNSLNRFSPSSPASSTPSLSTTASEVLSIPSPKTRSQTQRNGCISEISFQR
jgi:hypothetical protein